MSVQSSCQCKFRCTYISQCYRCRESIHEPCTSRCQLENSHSFGAHIIRQNLAGVNRLHRGEGESKDRAEDVDERDGSYRRCFTSSMYEVCCGTGGDCQANRHADSDAHKHLPATDYVMESSTDDRWDPAANRVDDIQK